MKKLKIEYKLEKLYRQNDVIDDLNDSRFHINFIVCSIKGLISGKVIRLSNLFRIKEVYSNYYCGIYCNEY
jgi:hypothetical protein